MNYASYGNIPYGSTFTGKLFYDLDDKEDDYACKNMKKIHYYSEKLGVFSIIMIDKGSCTLVTKTRNVQKLGGSLVLIINNDNEDIEEISFLNDGTASDIYIPTVLISKKDGNVIKNYLSQKANEYKTQKEFYKNVDIIMNVEFAMVINKIFP